MGWVKASLLIVALILFATPAVAPPPPGVSPGCPVVNPPGLDGGGPHDFDDNCHFEDVNGDGEVNILDTQTLFQNIDNPQIQNNAPAYDFSNVSPSGQVTIFDVAAHWLKHVR